VYAPDADAAEPGAPLATVEDYRCSADFSQVTDGEGTCNLFSPVNTRTA
jgi:hypothetical protein